MKTRASHALSLFAAALLAAWPGVSEAAEGFVAESGPIPANSTGVFWHSRDVAFDDAQFEIWRLDDDRDSSVGVVRLPAPERARHEHERCEHRGIVRPAASWAPGERYRFVYRGDGMVQKIEVDVVDATIDSDDVAATVSVRGSKPHHRSKPGQCISHCPEWHGRSVSALEVELDLGAWAQFAPHLRLRVLDHVGDLFSSDRRPENPRLLWWDCSDRPDPPSEFWLQLLFPAARDHVVGTFGPIAVRDVCDEAPMTDSWPELKDELSVPMTSPPPERSSTEPTTADHPAPPATAPDESVAVEPSTSLPADPTADRPRWTVQVDPLTTLLGYVHVQVERALSPRWSIYLGPSLRLFSAPFADPEEFIGIGGEAGLRLYFTRTAPRGWWVLTRGVLAQLRAGEQRTAGGYGSLLGGHTWVFGDWFVASLGLGVQVLHYTIAGLGTRGVLPAAHTTIGFAF